MKSELNAGGGVKTLSLRQSIPLPGVLRIDCAGLVTDSSLARFWEALGGSAGVLARVVLFDFRNALLAYGSPPKLVPGAPQLRPGAMLGLPEQFDRMTERAATLNGLGVRRAAFCSEQMALEWCADQAHLSLSVFPTSQRVRSAL